MKCIIKINFTCSFFYFFHMPLENLGLHTWLVLHFCWATWNKAINRRINGTGLCHRIAPSLWPLSAAFSPSRTNLKTRCGLLPAILFGLCITPSQTPTPFPVQASLQSMQVHILNSSCLSWHGRYVLAQIDSKYVWRKSTRKFHNWLPNSELCRHGEQKLQFLHSLIPQIFNCLPGARFRSRGDLKTTQCLCS